MYYSYLLRYTDVWSKRDRHYFNVLDILVEQLREQKLLREDITDETVKYLAIYITRGVTMEWSVSLTEYPIEEKDSLIDAFCYNISH